MNKFRVWDKEREEYIENEDFSLGILSGEVRGKYGEVFEHLEVEQWTGQTDQNDELIYKNDVLEIKGSHYVVVWDDEASSWAIEPWKDRDLRYGLYKSESKMYIKVGVMRKTSHGLTSKLEKGQ